MKIDPKSTHISPRPIQTHNQISNTFSDTTTKKTTNIASFFIIPDNYPSLLGRITKG